MERQGHPNREGISTEKTAMTEKQIRARLAQLEQELADEKAKNERAQQTIADLAQAAAWNSCPPPAWPFPGVPPYPQPVNPEPLPWAVTYYACSFPAPGAPVLPPTITYSGMLPTPKGKPPK